ncbi:hypothetical protein [Vibrio maritimus]|uniref:hypothetical protein n=1 Tax=Vibrio maritimus TaxID=990268 RepID=UPI001F207E18|nr:hypothetical protein [Vibrio maritimus]
MKKSLTAVSVAALMATSVQAADNSGTVEAYVDQDSNAGLYSAVDVTEDAYVEAEVAKTGYGYIGAGYMFTADTGVAAGYATEGDNDEARIQAFTGHSFGNFTLRGGAEYRHGFKGFVSGGNVTGDGFGSGSDVNGDFGHGGLPTPYKNSDVTLPAPHNHDGILPLPVPDSQNGNYTLDVHRDNSRIVKLNVGADYNIADQVTLSYDYDYYKQLGDFYTADDAQAHTFKATYTGFDAAQPYVKHAIDGDFDNNFTTVGIAIPF